MVHSSLISKHLSEKDARRRPSELSIPRKKRPWIGSPHSKQALRKHLVFECSKRGLRAFAHRDDDLLIGYGRHVSCSVNAFCRSSPFVVDYNLTERSEFQKA